MYQTDAYSATVQPSDEKSTLQKEVEDNEDIDCLMKNLLKQAILTCLKMAVGHCAKHECQNEPPKSEIPRYLSMDFSKRMD